MKKLIYFLFVIILSSACHRIEQANRINNHTEINLKFKDFNPNEHKSFIDLKIENGINLIVQQLKISDSGTVNYNFINPEKTELIFNYENKEFSLIASPNEKLTAEIMLTELLDGPKFKTFNVSGENELTNNLILGNTFYLDSLIQQSTRFYTNNREEQDVDYRVKRIAEMKNQLREFEQLTSAQNNNDITFINWGEAKIKYAAGYDLCIYPFFQYENNRINDEDEYFNFINEISPSNDYEITHQSYLKYLSALSMAYRIMSISSDKYVQDRENLKNDSLSNFPIHFSMIKKRPHNMERELLMAYAFKENPLVPNNYLDSLSSYINEELIAQVNFQKIDETKTIISLLKEYDISDQEKNELIELYKSTKGKVVFQTFWFTGCSNFVNEVPHLKDLKLLTDRENVEFIFYGSHMETDEWQKALNKYSLSGKHYLLSKNQLAFFQKYFGVHGIPHHHLIKSDGLIGKIMPHSITPTYFDEIIEMINIHQIEITNGV